MKVTTEIGRNFGMEVVWKNVASEYEASRTQFVALDKERITGFSCMEKVLQYDTDNLNKELEASGYERMDVNIAFGEDYALMTSRDKKHTIMITYCAGRFRWETDVLHLFGTGMLMSVQYHSLLVWNQKPNSKWYLYENSIDTLFEKNFDFGNLPNCHFKFKYHPKPIREGECVGSMEICDKCCRARWKIKEERESPFWELWSAEIPVHTFGDNYVEICARKIRIDDKMTILVDKKKCPYYAEHFMSGINDGNQPKE